MIKFYSVIFYLITSFVLTAQQIDNGSMESWDNLGSSTEEPENWNSFMSASGGLALFASQQVEQSSDVPSSSTGSYSARVFSKSTIGIIANGNLTLGRINMGSSTPSSSENYNYTDTGNSDFSQQLTSSPDSIVFWVKYNNSSNSDLARIKAIIHDDYNYVDPMTSESEPHVVADAALNFESTNGSWVRKSVAFDYVGPATTPEFILVTFTTNSIPGGGSDGDEIFIDDVELIYNSGAGIVETDSDNWIGYHSSTGVHLSSSFPEDEILVISDLMGKEVIRGNYGDLNGVLLNSGMYIVSHKFGSSKIIAD
tara:strand:+ start:8403 stop:9335 length:933 start_codon:yes stop_codon:yes gene_type:complete